MIDLAVKNVYLRTINLGFLERIRIGIVFDLFVYIFHGARNWVKTCRPAFLTSDSREMAFSSNRNICQFKTFFGLTLNLRRFNTTMK